MFRRNRLDRKPRCAQRRRKLIAESLEDRRLLAFGPPVGGEALNVFAVASGSIGSPGATSVEVLDTSAYTMPRNAIVVGFHVIGGGGLDPGAVQVSGPGVINFNAQDDLAGSNDSLVLARVGKGNISITVGGEANTTGTYTVEAFLAGDLNGDRTVSLVELRDIPTRLGSTAAGGAPYLEEADSNLDDAITRADLTPPPLNRNAVVVPPVALNSPPVITSDGGGATANVNAAENQTAVTTVTATDADVPPQTLTFTITGGADQALFGITAGGVLTFNAAPNFEIPADAGGNNVYDVQVTVTDDGPGNLTDVQDIAVTVTDVNENPVITSDGGGATANVNAAENQTAVTTVTATDADLPAQTLTFTITGGADQALFGITGGGILTFNAAPDFENPADAGGNNVYDVQVTVTDNGAPNLTDVQDIAVTVTDVVEVLAPVAQDDSYTATGNVGIAPGVGSVFANNGNGVDTGGPLVVSKVQGSAVNVGNSVATTNGSVTVNANGSFSYNPNAGFNGADTFTYTAMNAGGEDQATVTITTSDMIWFLDSTAPAGDGTVNNPFNALTGAGSFDALATDSVGDAIFLADGTYTGGITLLNNQLLIGEGSSAGIDVSAGITLAPNSNALPTTGGTDPVVQTSGITLGSGNTVRGLTIGNTGAGVGLSGTSVGTLTVSESTINGTGQAIDIDGGTLAVTFDSLSSASSGAEGIDINNVGGTFQVTGNTAITSPGSEGIDITSSAGATFTFADLDVTTSGQIGILVDGGGTLNATSGAISTGSGEGFDISDTVLGVTFDSVTVNGATDGIILDATSGSMTITTVNISNIVQTTPDNFNTVTGRPMALGDGNGISLEDHSGSFTVNGGTISDVADNAVDIRNSNNTTLNNVTIQDAGDGNLFSSGNTAIQWHLGSNLTLNNVTIEDIGDNIVIPTGGVNIHDSGIKAYDVSGDLDIIDSLFDGATGYVFANAVVGSEDRAVEVDNDTGTDLDVTVEGSTFRGFDFQALNLRHIGGSLDASIGGPTAGDVNTFENINGAAVSTGPSVESATGNVHGLEVENNQFTSVGIAVEVFSARGNAIGGVEGTHAFIEDNRVNGTIGDVFRLNAFGVGTTLGNNPIFRASLSNNTVTGVANLAPNTGGGSVFHVAAEDNADSDVTINNHPNLTGLVGGGTNPQLALTTQNQRSGDLDLIFTNNTFTNFPNSAVNSFGFAFLGSDLVTNSPQTQTAVRFGGNDWNLHTGGFFETVFVDAGAFATMDIEGFPGPNHEAALAAHLNSVDSDVASFGFCINAGTTVTGGGASVTGPTAFPTTPLLAAGGQGAGAVAIDAAALNGIVSAAISQLSASGLTAAQQAALDDVTFALVDLTDGMLGQASGNQIFIDIDAAGWGWFVDSTPDDDVEFGVGGDAEGRMDLLSAVMHELGHVLGHDHDDGVMSDTLATGTRADLDAFFASLD